MKTAIIYYSQHHGNTKKLLDALALLGDVELLDVTDCLKINSNTQSSLDSDSCKSEHANNELVKIELDKYELLGFASGVYYAKYHKSLLAFAEQYLPEGKKVFFMHTAGRPSQNQNAAIKAIAEAKGCRCLGTYCCQGFDTFGPFKLVGGLAKGHPNAEDIAGAAAFYQKLCEGRE